MVKTADLRSTLLPEYPHFSEVFGPGFNQDASLSGFAIILFTNRTGSNLLSHYLWEIFDSGWGQEVFNPAKMNESHRSGVVSFKGYIESLRSGSFPTPCIKVSAVQFNELLKRPAMFNGLHV
jgi:hypothetical protein